MKKILLLILVFSATLLTAKEKSKPVEFSLAPASKLKVELSSGNYELIPSKDGKLRVYYQAADQPHLEAVKVDFSSTAKHGPQLVLSETPHSDFTATIELPAQTDLDLHLSAGTLNIRPGIIGSKLITVHAGDVSVDVGDPAQYGHVEAGVTIGDLDAAPFNAEKGALTRTLHQTGPGRYTLNVHVAVGNLRLVSAAAKK